MKKILILFTAILPLCLFAQNIKPRNINASKIIGSDTTISTPFFATNAGWTIPFGEMGNRYTSFFNVNADLGWKTINNWLILIDFGFQFGSNNIKHMKDYLSSLYTNGANPIIVGTDGTDAGVIAYNRNLSLSLSLGKIFPITTKNPNSGIETSFALGFLQHQIIYEATQSRVLQLEGNYKYLYDRQMRGPMTGLFIGYRHISKSSYANWFAGIDWKIAFTKMTRDFQADLKGGDSKLYTDHMITIKIGWMFPFFGRSADKIYYY
ncbi:MAG: hypothetical protein ACTTJH_01215 [Bacteroidales bacterium]